ncbi:HD domain-containing phosphohydrolase [Polynucleobacter sphagniphilus]|uniref:HD domain-containing phosphohydrolase n=1 Tax=Polynucleobacter sphagniphilus TaxID=1743169 RepID=UPI0024753FB1|nr:HD domain-containing phosphohydrolase [Polynucleobacter sphagniphilus]MDH6299208.1 PAS domain S-box-containing protein/putative nucleotidyltransferase with HDIG domain [Polynucleobacter sphagniphilus]
MLFDKLSDWAEYKKMTNTNTDLNLRYRRLFETAQDGILILEFETGKIEDVNPYLIQMLGYTKEELVGMELWEIGAMVDKSASIKAFAVLQKDGYIKYNDLPLRTKDGKIISVEFVSNVYGVNGDRVIQCNIRDITSRKNAESSLIRYQQALSLNMYQVVEALTKVIVARDAYTYQHQCSVAHLCVAIATEMNLPINLIEGLKLSALIHDIGKIAVPAEILSKPTKLESFELEALHRHAQTGFDIVKNINFEWALAQTIYQHHERLDGSGYPNHLKGDSIIKEARILAVADTVEAMSHARPYRPAIGIDAALQEIENGKGRLFDAEVVDACLKLFREDGYQFPPHTK